MSEAGWRGCESTSPAGLAKRGDVFGHRHGFPRGLQPDHVEGLRHQGDPTGLFCTSRIETGTERKPCTDVKSERCCGGNPLILSVNICR